MAETTGGRVLTAHTRRHDVPHAFDALAGPASGRMLLPGSVYWGPEPEVDLGHPDDLLKAYEAVLREGSHAEICSLVNGALLRSVWPLMVLPAVVRRAWEARFPELRA